MTQSCGMENLTFKRPMEVSLTARSGSVQHFGPLDFSRKLTRRIARLGLSACIGLAILGPTAIAQAASYVAIGETAVIGKSGGSGSWSGNYTSTQTANGKGQQLTEVNSEGSMRLLWTYRFGGWSDAQTITALTIKGYAINNRGNNEPITLSVSAKLDPDPYQDRDWVAIGSISSTASSNTQTFTLPNLAMAAGQLLHLRIVDTLATNDMVANSYRIDQMFVTAQGSTPPTPTPTGPATTKQIIGYFTQWSIYGKGRIPKLTASGVPADKVTIINYAFLNLDSQGNVISGDEFADYNHTKDPIYSERGNFAQLRALRRDYPHLKLVLSVGGWTWSNNFSLAAATAASRERFATTLAHFVEEEDFDGADIDWEYPTGDPAAGTGEADNAWSVKDPVNHALLLLAVRAKLDELSARTGKSYFLSIATPAGYLAMAKVLPPLVNNNVAVNGFTVAGNEFLPGKMVGAATAAQALQHVNVMVYDMAGAPWSQLSRHHAPLYPYQIAPREFGDPGDPSLLTGSPAEHWQRYNAHFALRGHRNVYTDYTHLDGLFEVRGGVQNAPAPVGGFAPSQIILGVATYGRGFTRVVNGDNGLFGIHSGDNNGSATEPVWFYYDILSKSGTVYRPGDDPLADPLSPTYAQTAYGPYKFDGSLFIGYDDVRLVKQKARHIVDQEYGGLMFWEFRFDASSPDTSLFNAAKLGFESLAPR